MATRSTAGKRIGMFQSTRHSDAIEGLPSATSERSVLVPPMSSVITFSKPAAFPTTRPPMTPPAGPDWRMRAGTPRSDEHTSELQSRETIVCRLLLEKKKKKITQFISYKKKKTSEYKTNI